jgi:hypothetical protein
LSESIGIVQKWVFQSKLLQGTFFQNNVGNALPFMGVHHVVTIKSQDLRMAVVGDAFAIVTDSINTHHIRLILDGSGF